MCYCDGIYPVNIAIFLWGAFFTEHLWWLLLKNTSIQDSVYIIHTRLTQGLLQLFLLSLIGRLNEPEWGYYWIIYYTFHFLLRRVLKLIKFSNLHIFCLSQWLFLRWFAYKSLLSIFSLLMKKKKCEYKSKVHKVHKIHHYN